jgi:DNA-binding NtrC family response regulator
MKSQGKILYGENDAAVLKHQSQLFERAGYTVEQAIGRKGVQDALKRATFDVVVLGHTLSRDDRHHLPYMAKKSSEATRVLVLHASGRHHAVDLAIDSRDGDPSIVDAVRHLMSLEPVMA